LELPITCLQHFSKVGDVVCDPFMGSGTTGVACKQLNRNFIGMEINEDYLKLSKERIDASSSFYIEENKIGVKQVTDNLNTLW
jgi:DNA modification methylase